MHHSDNYGTFCGGCVADKHLGHILKGLLERMKSSIAGRQEFTVAQGSEHQQYSAPDDLKLSSAGLAAISRGDVKATMAVTEADKGSLEQEE